MKQYEISHAALKLGFDYYPMVPDTKIDRYFDIANTPNVLIASREEESAAIGCGLLLSGSLPLVLIHSSGLINSSNTIGTFAVSYGIPLIIACSIRGDSFDVNKAHRPVYNAIESCMRMMGCKVHHISASEDFYGRLKHVQADAIVSKEPAIIFF